MKKLLLILMFSLKWISADELVSNLHRYIMANYYQFGQNIENAGKWYSQMTPTDQSKYVYYGYIPFLHDSGHFQQIVTLMPELDEVFAKNQPIQTLFAQALAQIGKKQEAQAIFIALNDQNKTNAELAFKVVQIYLERKELENALLVINNLLNKSPRRPNNYIFLFVQSQIYLQLNKKEEALSSIQACIDMYPRFDKSWLLYAILQEQDGKIDQAIKGYTNFLEITEESHKEIEQHLLQLAFKEKLTQQKAPHVAINVCVKDALHLFEQKNYNKALTSLNQCLAQRPHDLHAQILKIQILTQQENYFQAMQYISTWLMEHSEHEHLWLQALHMVCNQCKNYSQAISLLHHIEHKKGFTALRSAYIADFALRDQNTKEALSALHKAYDLSHDTEFKAHMAFQIALLHYEAQEWNAFKKIAEQSIALKLKHAPLLNLIAYYDATKGKNLERAQELIAHALSHDSKNPHYLDTQSLIWYKQKKFDDAIALLEPFANQCDHGCMVQKRLGKLHYAKGAYQDAKKYLLLAQETASAPEKLKIEKLIHSMEKNK